MKRIALTLIFTVLLGWTLFAEEVPCGVSGEPRLYDPPMAVQATNWHCDSAHAYAEMGRILAGLATAASPDTCKSCPEGSVGCSRVGHTVPGPGAQVWLEEMYDGECPGDGLSHRYVASLPNAKHYISCTACTAPI
jgi:hypothetical protein